MVGGTEWRVMCISKLRMKRQIHSVSPSVHAGGGGGVRKGTICWENFAFQFGAEFFPTKIFLCNLGFFLLLAHPLWWRSPGIVALLTPVRLFVISIHLVRLGVRSWSSSGTFMSFVRVQNRPHLFTVGGVEVPRV